MSGWRRFFRDGPTRLVVVALALCAVSWLPGLPASVAGVVSIAAMAVSFVAAGWSIRRAVKARARLRDSRWRIEREIEADWRADPPSFLPIYFNLRNGDRFPATAFLQPERDPETGLHLYVGACDDGSPLPLTRDDIVGADVPVRPDWAVTFAVKGGRRP